MMSDELREAVSENLAVKDAATAVHKARQDLVEACTGTRPIDMRRIGREERSILFAAQAVPLCRARDEPRRGRGGARDDGVASG